jgi:Ran GTPase-activating protein (RanGAP) involved in mRNA processing and transport
MGINCAKMIAALIEENDHFVKITLSKNVIRDEGAKYLAHALIKDKKILELDLSSNGLTDKGIKYLCEVLLNNYTMISLKINSFEGLNRNKITQQGMLAVKEVLQKNKVSCSKLS